MQDETSIQDIHVSLFKTRVDVEAMMTKVTSMNAIFAPVAVVATSHAPLMMRSQSTAAPATTAIPQRAHSTVLSASKKTATQSGKMFFIPKDKSTTVVATPAKPLQQSTLPTKSLPHGGSKTFIPNTHTCSREETPSD